MILGTSDRADLQYWRAPKWSIKLNALPMRDEEIKLMEVWGFYAQLLDYAYHCFYSVNNL